MAEFENLDQELHVKDRHPILTIEVEKAARQAAEVKVISHPQAKIEESLPVKDEKTSLLSGKNKSPTKTPAKS
jgi:hypothetical protein